MGLIRMFRDVRDIARLAMAQIEVAAAAHAAKTTERKTMEDEIASWGLDVLTEDEAVSFILDDDYGLPEGFEWIEDAEYTEGDE